MIRALLAISVGAMLLAGCGTPSRGSRVQLVVAPSPPGLTISWQVDHRFRLLSNADEEERFYRDLSAYAVEYDVWFRREDDRWRLINYMGPDLIHTDPIDSRQAQEDRSAPPRDYDVNYDVGAHSYSKGDWLRDSIRTVKLTTVGLRTGQCIWSVDDVARAPRPCADEVSENVTLGEAKKVSVKALSDHQSVDARPAEAHTQVLVRDIKIVALGDSFSAGEGNPHTQWRTFTRRAPASWLDPRCHRSLLSGPSLTAAYLARNNPHISVTLLHYGCSGASIHDGLVTPWSLLDTAKRANNLYKRRGYKVPLGIPLSQRAEVLGDYDIAPSQIDMAESDLTLVGASGVNDKVTKPDFILISVGGNDVGFANIVSAMAFRSRVDGDLRATVTPDDRAVVTFDDAAWKAVDKTCTSDDVPCLGQRVQARVSSMLSADDETIGFGLVAKALTRLTSIPGDVYLTQYPNFVMRERHASGARSATPDPDRLGCNDAPFDGRPALAPTIAALIPGLGLRRKDAEQAQDQFMTPLNGALEAAAKKNGWNLVTSHLTRDAGHGVCAFRRYFNTFVDSHWNQGRRDKFDRPLGNFVVMAKEAGLPAGTRGVWDKECFVEYLPEMPLQSLEARAAQRSCLKTSRGADPAFVALQRERPHRVETGSDLDSSGVVHPNYFGHCSYAAAIISKMSESGLLQYRDVLNAEFLMSAKDLHAESLCRPEAWGYQEVARRKAGRGWVVGVLPDKKKKP